MSLVFAAVCSHAPGITGRAHLADPVARDAFYDAMGQLHAMLISSQPEALIIVAAEHFANFFMNNMPAFALGIADRYEGPIENSEWLGIKHVQVPGNYLLSLKLISEMLQTVDLAYAKEWKLDHGIMVPLHFLTPAFDLPIIPININCQGPPMAPLHRVWALGQAIRSACNDTDQRIALIGTGGISHWPATPDSGKINREWDQNFMLSWCHNNKNKLLSYSDAEILRDAGQGGFEIRTFIAVAAAAGGKGRILHSAPIPIFAVSCTAAVMEIGSTVT